MNTAIIGGGTIEAEFVSGFILERQIDCVIAADRGLEFCFEQNIMPDYIMGDYDSIRPEILDWYRNQSNAQVITFPVEKDDTDTAIAFLKALEIGSDTIYLFGALGGRMDHAIANIQILKNVLDYPFFGDIEKAAWESKNDISVNTTLMINEKSLKRKVQAYIVDAHNIICLIDKETVLKKEKQFGKYVSLLPFTDTVEGITLEGFKYPLTKYTMKKGESTGVSNEIVDEEAKVTIQKGLLLMIQSRD